MDKKVKPSLVVMAAGMGSRFGGLKQIIPVGPSGERIVDYSVYDALRAGFGKIIFVIKKEIEDDFRAAIGDRLACHADVRYVFQELDSLPEGCTLPPDRTKPWGTGHAVLCAAEHIDGPFAAINADDFYGRDCYELLCNFMNTQNDDGKLHIAMAGFVLENTLTENGYVSRGVCKVSEDGMLLDIHERVRIERRDGGAAYTEDDGESWIPLEKGCRVSMNCWAFPAGMTAQLERLFRKFMEEFGDKPGKEFYLPFAVDSLIGEGIADVKVLETHDKWYGMTYKEDRQRVTDAIRSLVDEGKYPKKLFTEC